MKSPEDVLGGHAEYSRPHELQIGGLVDVAAWGRQGVPVRRWAVPGLIPARNLTMLMGDGGLGKSTLTQTLLTAATIGGQWLGRNVTKCRALGLFCEDETDELHRRQEQINAHFNVTYDALHRAGLTYLSRVGSDNSLLRFNRYDPPKPTAFFEDLRKYTLAGKFRLVVLDSLHDLFSGNENDRPQAHAFMSLLRRLALDIDGTVIVNAHPSLSGLNSGSGSAGSTAWNNACRSRLYFRRPDGENADPNIRILSHKKSNYAALADDTEVTWQDGVFVPVSSTVDGLAWMAEGKVRDTFLALLDSIQQQGRSVTDGITAQRYAPRVFAGMEASNGYTVKQFSKAMQQLFDRGEIVIGKVEKYGNGEAKKGIIRNNKGDQNAA